MAMEIEIRTRRWRNFYIVFRGVRFVILDKYEVLRRFARVGR